MILVKIRISDIVHLTILLFSCSSFWILASSYLLVIGPAGFFIGLFTERWRIEIDDTPSKSLKDAGLWIGRLERIIMLTLILTKQYSTIGFLIAAKSIFRFGEINKANNRTLTEYFLIGTLASITASLIIGIATLLLLAHVK